MNPEEFTRACQQNLRLELTDHQLDQFATYYQRLVAANKHVNLTRITAEDEVYLKHFYDSLTGISAVPALATDSLSLADIGAGAGFPSLPLLIANPQLKVTIVDSLNKRINFLADLLDDLKLPAVTLVHARAEDFSAKKSPHRERYDLVTARAVARLNVLVELCLPAVKVGGLMLAYKGSAGAEEIDQARGAIKKLGGQLVGSKTLTLPGSDEARDLVLIKKVRATPKAYPRKAGTPKRAPLS